MPDNLNYEFRLRGELPSYWSDWFDGLTIQHVDGETLLSGPVSDQAALHGILNKIRDLGLILLSVETIEEDPSMQ
jgi:hypothetical protein